MTYYVVRATPLMVACIPIVHWVASEFEAQLTYIKYKTDPDIHSVEIVKVSTWLFFWWSKLIRANLPMHKLHKPDPLWARSLGLTR